MKITSVFANRLSIHEKLLWRAKWPGKGAAAGGLLLFSGLEKIGSVSMYFIIYLII